MGLLSQTERAERRKRLQKLLENYRTLKTRYLKTVKENRRLALQLITNADSGLPNAVLMHRQLMELLKRDEKPKAVCFLRLNEMFSLVRRTFSSKIPEWILYQTGVRLRSIVRDAGKVFHTRDDEFFVVLFDISDEAAYRQVLARLVRAIEKPHVLGGYNISLRANLGLAQYPRDGQTKSEILRSADIALSVAIRRQVMVYEFNPSLKMEQLERIEIQNGLLQALQTASDRQTSPFEMHYQPQVELLDLTTNSFRVIGAESLIRWRHPSLGYLSPGRFIPVAEETGLIVPLSAWILRRSLQEAAEWQTCGLGHLQMAINLSTRQFTQEDVVDDVVKLCKRYHIPRHCLKFEITEGTLMQNLSESSKKIETLLRLGFKIMLDDFGTGYSSLSYLRSLPISVIKIDKSFVDGVPHDASAMAPIRAILHMAREMKKGVIVEGVERWEQVEWLYLQGCRVFQGYFFSKPLPAQEFRSFSLSHLGP